MAAPTSAAATRDAAIERERSRSLRCPLVAFEDPFAVARAALDAAKVAFGADNLAMQLARRACPVLPTGELGLDRELGVAAAAFQAARTRQRMSAAALRKAELHVRHAEARAAGRWPPPRLG